MMPKKARKAWGNTKRAAKKPPGRPRPVMATPSKPQPKAAPPPAPVAPSPAPAIPVAAPTPVAPIPTVLKGHGKGDPLADPRLRLDRADEHLADLEREIASYLDGKPYRLVGQREAQTGQNVIRAFIDSEPPDRLKVLIGDVCHSLRTALNQLAYVLATPAGGGDAPSGTEFPIFKDRPIYAALHKKTGQPAKGSGLHYVRGVEPKAQAVIESLQPYHRASDPEGHELWILHELDVVDKHRKGLLSGTILQGAGMGINEMHGGYLYVEHVGRGARTGAFQNGAEVARFSYSGGSGQLRMNLNAIFTVAFNPKGPGRGAPVLDCLTGLRNYVHNVVFPQLEVFV